MNKTEKNIIADAELFKRKIEKYLKGSKHDHYVLYFGCDFIFKSKNNNFLNIEALMTHVNTNEKDIMEVKYSTVEEYFQTVNQSLKNQTLSHHQGDFFPYIDPAFLTWTGYFTSRPYLIGVFREQSIFYSISSYFILEYFLKTNYYNNEIYNLQSNLQISLVINQHHDAITGTTKTYVSNNYISMLEQGFKQLNKAYGVIMRKIYNLNNITLCLRNGKSQLSCNESFITDMLDNSSDSKNFGIINQGLDGQILITFEFSISTIPVFLLYDNNNKLIEKDDICIPDKKCYSFFLVKLKKEILIYPLLMKKRGHSNPNYSTILSQIPEDNITLISNTLMIKEITYTKSKNKLYITLSQQKDNIFQISVAHATFTGSNLEGPYFFKPTKSPLIKDLIEFEKHFKLKKNYQPVFFFIFREVIC